MGWIDLEPNKKVESNRRNAKKSSGPINTEKTRLNATKHGILSGGGVIEEIDGENSRELFDDMANQMWEQLAPAGFMEEDLVYQMIESKWRRRRLRRLEFNLIQVQVNKRIDRWLRRRLDDGSLLQVVANHRYKEGMDSPDLDALRDITDGLKGMVDALESGTLLTGLPNLSNVMMFAEDYHEVKVKEVLVDSSPNRFENPLGLIRFDATEVQQVIDAVCEADEIDEVAFRGGFLAYMKELYEFSLKEQNREIENYNRLLVLSSMPDDANFAKLSRYDTSLFNQGMKLFHELQRLQAARLGAKPSLPIAVDLTLGSEFS